MTPYGKIVICFNTYFMRDGWYRNNRTRYEDPVTLQIGWRGIPLDGVDANVHVWSRKRDVVYVFKGTQSWSAAIETPFPTLQASLDATRINEISHADGAQATAAPER
ncbi:Matrix metallopeptidase-21 [Channa argus]|uniref:Matrix metallopeptidase-21 n=1 Tax=Channa argus TaxID=215402 RepID=A0A6G1QP11_CHAAH|nr:Matrix metallopeptidase-21 [Channa argus]